MNKTVKKPMNTARLTGTRQVTNNGKYWELGGDQHVLVRYGLRVGKREEPNCIQRVGGGNRGGKWLPSIN